MTERFKQWFDWLIPWEGTTYENDPDDPGGETKYGIDKRSHPGEDIPNLTRSRAREIYWTDYWTPIRAEQLPAGVGEVVADIAVNNGLSRSAKWLQKAVGTRMDGVIGPMTLAAVSRINPLNLATHLLERRAEFYRSIARGRQAKYLRGWLNRNQSLWTYVQKILSA